MQVVLELLFKSTDEAVILKRQIKSNETALTSVAEHLVKLKIRDIPGEDVEELCAQINSGCKALENASVEGYNYVPQAFDKSILSATLVDVNG